jgi:hypothetical protein
MNPIDAIDELAAARLCVPIPAPGPHAWGSSGRAVEPVYRRGSPNGGTGRTARGF